MPDSRDGRGDARGGGGGVRRSQRERRAPPRAQRGQAAVRVRGRVLRGRLRGCLRAPAPDEPPRAGGSRRRPRGPPARRALAPREEAPPRAAPRRPRRRERGAPGGRERGRVRRLQRGLRALHPGRVLRRRVARRQARLPALLHALREVRHLRGVPREPHRPVRRDHGGGRRRGAQDQVQAPQLPREVRPAVPSRHRRGRRRDGCPYGALHARGARGRAQVPHAVGEVHQQLAVPQEQRRAVRGRERGGRMRRAREALQAQALQGGVCAPVPDAGANRRARRRAHAPRGSRPRVERGTQGETPGAVPRGRPGLRPRGAGALPAVLRRGGSVALRSPRGARGGRGRGTHRSPRRAGARRHRAQGGGDGRAETRSPGTRVRGTHRG